MVESFDGFLVRVANRHGTPHFRPEFPLKKPVDGLLLGDWACAMTFHDRPRLLSPFPPGCISVFLISTADWAASSAASDLPSATLGPALASGAQSMRAFPVRKASGSRNTCRRWNERSRSIARIPSMYCKMFHRIPASDPAHSLRLP